MSRAQRLAVLALIHVLTAFVGAGTTILTLSIFLALVDTGATCDGHRPAAAGIVLLLGMMVGPLLVSLTYGPGWRDGDG